MFYFYLYRSRGSIGYDQLYFYAIFAMVFLCDSRCDLYLGLYGGRIIKTQKFTEKCDLAGDRHRVD